MFSCGMSNLPTMWGLRVPDAVRVEGSSPGLGEQDPQETTK